MTHTATKPKRAMSIVTPSTLPSDELREYINECLDLCTQRESEYIRLRVASAYSHQEALLLSGLADSNRKPASALSTLRPCVYAAIEALRVARHRELPYDPSYVLERYVALERTAHENGDFGAARACLRDMASFAGLDPAQRVNISHTATQTPCVNDILKLSALVAQLDDIPDADT